MPSTSHEINPTAPNSQGTGRERRHLGLFLMESAATETTTKTARSPWLGPRLACGYTLFRTSTLLSVLNAPTEALRQRLLPGGKGSGRALLLWKYSTGPPSTLVQVLWHAASCKTVRAGAAFVGICELRVGSHIVPWTAMARRGWASSTHEAAASAPERSKPNVGSARHTVSDCSYHLSVLSSLTTPRNCLSHFFTNCQKT